MRVPTSLLLASPRLSPSLNWPRFSLNTVLLTSAKSWLIPIPRNLEALALSTCWTLLALMVPFLLLTDSFLREEPSPLKKPSARDLALPRLVSTLDLLRLAVAVPVSMTDTVTGDITAAVVVMMTVPDTMTPTVVLALKNATNTVTATTAIAAAKESTVVNATVVPDMKIENDTVANTVNPMTDDTPAKRDFLSVTTATRDTEMTATVIPPLSLLLTATVKEKTTVPKRRENHPLLRFCFSAPKIA